MNEAPPTVRRILLLAAEGLRAALLEQFARCPEFEIAETDCPQEASRRLAAGGVDALLVDADIGHAFAHSARDRFRGPILVIGAPCGTAGAALDYMARPLRFARLLAWLRAMRREAGDDDGRVVAIGSYRYRPGAFELTDAADASLPLTEKEAQILTRLVVARGEVVTKDVLLRDVWGYHPAVTTRTLETHVSRLRRKIETDSAGARHLLTEKNGYRLMFVPRED